jgi:hypothetical protein
MKPKTNPRISHAITIASPVGWEAGRQLHVGEAIQATAIEMMGHRSDILEKAVRAPLGDMSALETADILEKYATALNVIFFQIEPDRWNYESCKGVIELARKHGVAIPDWMTDKESTR